MKQKQKTLRRPVALAAVTLALLTVAALPVLAAPELDPNTAVNDYADILSTETETYVENLSVALQDTCGAQIGVYTTEYIGNSTMEGYAYDLLNTWGLGSADKDNGVLLLLVPGEDDYYVTRGAGLETQLTISTLGTILDEDLEPNCVKGDYDTGTQQTVYAIAEKLCSIYGIPTSTLDGVTQSAAPARQEQGPSPVTVAILLLVVLLVVVLVLLLVVLVVLYYIARIIKHSPYRSFFACVNFPQFTPACFVQFSNLHAGVLTNYTPECML